MRKLTYPQQRLLGRLPVGEWVDVPTATRHSTVTALVKLGLIEHRSKRATDWVVWGEVRKLTAERDKE